MPILLLLAIITSGVFILSKLNFFPYPELFVYSYLTKTGLIPYKEIFDQHFPGIMFFPLNLATLGIDTPGEMRILQYFLFALSQILLYLISKYLFKSDKKAIFVCLLYLPWQIYLEGYVLWIESFVTPIILAAFYVFILTKTKAINNNLFWVGFLFGLALLFKQVALPLILLSLIYIWFKYHNVNAALLFLLGLTIPCLIIIYFVARNGIFKEFFFWTATFNLTAFAETGRTYPSLKGILKISPVFLPGIFWAIYLLLKGKYDHKLTLPLIFLAGSLVFAFARFDFVHLQPALPFAVLLAYQLFNTFYKQNIALVFLFLGLFVFIPLKNIPFLKGEKVFFYGQVEKELASKIERYAAQGDTIFAFGTTPHIYQMTSTLPPGRIFVFQFPWFMDVAEGEVYQALISDTPKVIIRDTNSRVGGKNLTDHMPRIKSYINRYFKVIDVVGDIEVMIPK